MDTRTLASLREGESARVVRIGGTGEIRRRLQDIGLIGGTPVVCMLKSPAGDPAAYEIRGALIAIRKEDAGKVRITGIQEGNGSWG